MDVEGEDSQHKKTRPTHHHWRSLSWTGCRGGCLNDPNFCCDTTTKPLAQIDSTNEENSTGPLCDDFVVTKVGSGNVESTFGPNCTRSAPQKVLCLPLQSLSVSQQEGVDANSDVLNTIQGKGWKCMRSGIDIKLDLVSMQEQHYEMDGNDEDHSRKNLTQCDKQCSRILAHIYIGGNTVAQNYETLHSCKITHILNCVGFICPEYFPQDFHYKILWLEDNPSEDIICILYNVFDYFEDVREQGGRVLVHCVQGVSRSVSLVIAYLMWHERRPYEEVFDMVKAIRCVISPNLGFAFQLLQWYTRILQKPTHINEGRLPSLRMYRMAPYSTFDPLHLIPKYVPKPTMASLDSRGTFVLQLKHGIFIWRGGLCTNIMVVAADRTAFQLIHYEHASGPIVTIHDGSEPCEIRNILSINDNEEDNIVSQPLQDVHFATNIEGEALQLHSTHGEDCIKGIFRLRNTSYDYDFDLLQKSENGVLMQPLLIKIGHLPARDGNWNVHRNNNVMKSNSKVTLK